MLRLLFGVVFSLISFSGVASQHSTTISLSHSESIIVPSNALKSVKQKQTKAKLSFKERLIRKVLEKKMRKAQKRADSDRPLHWTNIASVIAGVLATIAVFVGGGVVFLLCMPIAIILGIIGITKSGKDGEFSGQGAGIAGLVLGGLLFLVSLTIVGLIIAFA